MTYDLKRCWLKCEGPKPGEKSASGAPITSIDFFDSELSGLLLRVSVGGSRTWYISYRTADGRKCRFKIGRAEVLDHAVAAKQAREKLAEVTLGRDPAADRREARKAEERRASGVDSFGKLAERYMEEWSKPRKRTADADQRMLNLDILPALKDKGVKAVKRADIRGILALVLERGTEDQPNKVRANRVLSLLGSIYSFALSLDLADINPTVGIRRQPETSRDRVLSEAEIKELWEVCDKQGAAFADAFRLSLLTGQRKNEVLGLEWKEIDASGWWTLPKERSKNKLSHRIYLAPQARAIIERRRKAAPDAVYIFQSETRDGSTKNVQEPLAALREETKIDFHWHDLRRTAGTLMTGKCDVDLLTVSKVLNHSVAGITAKVYDRSSYDHDKRVAMERLDRCIAGIVGLPVKPAKVTPLREVA